jgi:DnaJ-class molecular chaperone
MTYQDFKTAIEIFQLGERANLGQIRTRHRELVKAHHPDQDKEIDPEAIRKVNCAYEILMEYCNSYRFCFSEEEFLEQTPTERLKRQFGWDPVWSGQSEQEDD